MNEKSEKPPLEKAKLLRIFLGELDKYKGRPLYEAIIRAAQQEGLAGATVLRGVESFGASHHVHTAKILRLAEQLPLVIEIVDGEENIRAFLEPLHELLDSAGAGGLVTLEAVEIMRYQPRQG